MSNRIHPRVQEIDAKVFALPPGSKSPYRGKGRHGHKEAQSVLEASIGTDENYGIALDGQFIVVDFDRADTEHWKDRLPTTWKVQTRKGEHWLYSIPSGWGGRNRTFTSGDVKAKGYIVGPGSTVEGHSYVLADPRDPTEAPQWLLDYCLGGDDQQSSTGDGLDTIPDGGGRDDFLAAAAGLGRRWNLSERGLTRLVAGLIQSEVVESGANPKTLSDAKRIARSAMRYEPEVTLGSISPEGITNAADVPLVQAPTEWWIRGFIPRGELVMMYGRGAAGKSSFASNLACEVVKAGGRFLFVGVEEPFWRFTWRCVLGGLNERNMLCSVDNASSFLLPRDVDKLKKIITEVGVDVVYLDSVYSHFESGDNLNAAERARKCLGPLAELAQELKVTILSTFHENKTGAFLGSVEMVNVARCVLHATRIEGGPMVVEASKTNLIEPGYKLTYVGTPRVMADPETGEVQLERQEDGILTPMTVIVAERGENRKMNEIPLEELAESKGLEGY